MSRRDTRSNAPLDHQQIITALAPFGVTDPYDLSPDALLDRVQLAAALTGIGLAVTPETLANWASRGSGPPFQKWRKAAVRYRWGTSLQWAGSRLSAPHSSTAEHRAA